MFSFVSEIVPEHFDRPITTDTPNSRIFLTLDLDWCHEEVLIDTLELIETYNARATFFCTDRPKSLDLLRGNSRVELGIHPNFLPLFGGRSQTSVTAATILDSLLDQIPEARSVRSHSLVSGSNLSSLFSSRGLQHESNVKIPLGMKANSTPFYNFAGLISCPFHWSDYGDVGTNIEQGLGSSYLMVLFHPIHIFLNSENVTRYEETRPIHFSPKHLVLRRYEGYGARSQFMELLATLSSRTSVNNTSRAVEVPDGKAGVDRFHGR
jgi:hypothetical protein